MIYSFPTSQFRINLQIIQKFLLSVSPLLCLSSHCKNNNLLVITQYIYFILQSSKDLSAYRKSMRINQKIVLTDILKHDFISNFCSIFIKIKENFRSNGILAASPLVNFIIFVE